MVKKKINYAFLSAVLTIPVFLLIFYFAEKLPGGRGIFLYSDLRAQYIAFAKLFWQSILNGEGIEYTFHVSLGMPSVPLYTNYSLSPFNILYVLINHEELASIVLVVLKLSLAAYTFQRFSAKVLKNDSVSSVFFSVAYALNGYCIIFYYNIIFLDGIYMLPVIFILLVEAVKEKRYAKLTLAYAYLFIVQFYEGYIIGFFSLLFFILLMVAEYKKEWKKYIHASAGFGISVLTAALIGAAFLYPTAIFILRNHNVDNTSYWQFVCHIWNIYNNLFIGQFQTVESFYPYIYCGVMVLYLIPCYFADRSIERIHKIIVSVLIGYLILCSLWPQGYMFMHCFDMPNGCGFRFAYFYPFVLLAIACVEFQHMDSKRIWELVLLFFVHVTGYIVLNMGEESIPETVRIGNVLFLIIFLMIFILYKKYSNMLLYQWVVLGIVCVELIINGVIVINKFEDSSLLSREVYNAFNTINRQAVDEIRNNDQSFYRIAQENPYNLNDCAMSDYYGIAYFSTVENIRLRETLSALGYAVSDRTVYDNGETPLTSMLFSQKYEIIANSAEYILGNAGALWKENNNTLSLGYMVSDSIFNTTLDNDNAFENINSLVLGMTGQNIRAFVPYTGEITGITENMSVLWNGGHYIMLPDEGAVEGSLTFCLEDDTSLPVYAYFSQEESYKISDSYYFISNDSDRMRFWGTSILSLAQIIKLGKDDQGKYYIGIYFDETHTDKNYFKESYFYCYDDGAEERVYELLQGNQLRISEMKGSDITAEIDVLADRPILFTSIPYDEGWHVLVDGQEVDTLAVVNDTFLAVELTEGYHELKFYYSSAINKTGLMLSIAGIIIYMYMVLSERKMIKMEESSVNGGS